VESLVAEEEKGVREDAVEEVEAILQEVAAGGDLKRRELAPELYICV
jgi:hypothetical protein